MATLTRASREAGLVKFSILMPPELVEELDQIARQQYSSRGAVLRQLVDLGMEQRRRQQAAIEAAV